MIPIGYKGVLLGYLSGVLHIRTTPLVCCWTTPQGCCAYSLHPWCAFGLPLRWLHPLRVLLGYLSGVLYLPTSYILGVLLDYL